LHDIYQTTIIISQFKTLIINKVQVIRQNYLMI
jgi:hypothetical protein